MLASSSPSNIPSKHKFSAINMTLIVHHLQRSQSEPIVWLCEELGLQYELKIYRRKQKREGLGAPPELKAL